RGHVHVHLHDEIPTATAPQRRCAEPAQTQLRAVLRAVGNLELHRAVERVEVEAGAESGLHHRDAQLTPQLVAASLQRAVGRDAHRDIQIARRSAAWACGTTTGQAEALALIDALRDLDVDRTRTFDSSRATAHLAGIRDGLARAPADRARRRGHELAQQRAAHLTDFTGSVARLAALRVRARPAA